MFERAMPYYLHIGMTPSDYWDGSAELCIAYREKAKMDAEFADAIAWQQGAYIYEALMNLAPIFGMNKGKTKPYPSKPHSANSSNAADSKRDKQSKIEAGKAFMNKFMREHNAARRKAGKTPSQE